MNDQYADLYSSYRWLVPSQFNIAQACLYRWAENSHEGRRAAIYTEDEFGRVETWSFSQLSETTNRLANGLTRMGVQPGDRVGIAMGQRPETIATYMAVFSVGAVAVPLTGSLGANGVEARMRHAQARVAVVDTFAGPDLLQAHLNYPELSQIIGLGFQHDHIIPWRTLLARQPSTFKAELTPASRPALLVYDVNNPTPNGVVFSHSALIGSLPGFVASQNWFPNRAAAFWSPADWTSTSGLLAAILPALYFGRPVVATLGRFSGARALEVLDRYGVTHAYFLAEQAQQLADEIEHLPADLQLGLRCVALSGLSNDNNHVYDWFQRCLGIAPNIVLGMPEAPVFIGNSQEKWPSSPGSIGRPYPGHLAAVLNSSGLPCAAGVVGELALNRHDIHGHFDPALFVQYWDNPDATQARYAGDWCLSGMLAKIDEQGNYWYMGKQASTIQS